MKLRNLIFIFMAIALNAFANITGTLDFSGAGLVSPSNTKVGFHGIMYPVSSEGKYTITTVGVKERIKTNQTLTEAYDHLGRKINFNQPQSWSSKFTSLKQYTYNDYVGAARSMDVTDTLYIVVSGDTLREVPIASWDTILPPNYVVQRNVGVTVPASRASDVVQVVWWNNDSIANVLDLGKASTNNQKYSGYIYTVYDDVAFRLNSSLYSLFVRTRKNDSIKSYTGILDVKARVGDLTFGENEFKLNTIHSTAGYSLTPNDSNVATFNLTKTVSMEYVTDSTFDTLTYDSSFYRYINRDTVLNKCEIGRNMRRTFIGSHQDTAFDTTLTETFKAIATKDADTVKLKVSYSDSIQYLNVKVGDTLIFRETGNFGESHKFNYAWFSNIQAIIVRKIIRQYWK